MIGNEIEEQTHVVILPLVTKKGLSVTSIIIGGLGVLSCCCCNFIGILSIPGLILGIISLFKATKAESLYNMSDFYGAENEAKSANTMALLGCIFAISAVGLSLIYFVLGIIFQVVGFAAIPLFSSSSRYFNGLF